MLDVCLLGTGGTVPLPNRWLTSLLIRWSGHELLVDCGEGTQVALNKQAISCKHVDTILITHFHADHTAGLPGFLLSMAKAERVEPVTIIGPKGLSEVVEGVKLLARYIPFEINCIEINEKEYSFELDNLKVTSFNVKHSVPCVGYCFELKRNRKFDVEKARSLNIPLVAWKHLQRNESYEVDGVTYEPDMVMGKERRGLKMVYATDTRPNALLEKYAQDCDLLITEGMYGDNEKIEKAKLNKHMLMDESCKLALKSNVKELWLTHFSPSMHDPYMYDEQVKAIFANTVICHDGQHKDLAFIDEE